MKYNVFKRSLLALAAVLILFQGCVAQKAFFRLAGGTIQGTVSDADSGDRLAGANIVLHDAKLGAVSDLQGNYKIRGVPAGQATVSVYYIGYEQLTASVTVRMGQTTTLNAELKVER